MYLLPVGDAAIWGVISHRETILQPYWKQALECGPSNFSITDPLIKAELPLLQDTQPSTTAYHLFLPLQAELCKI